jgi:hypothetical protein
VELASNLVWAVVSVILLGMTYRGVRRGAIQLSMGSAFTLTLFVCFLLLPVISISDDLMAAKQGALPLAGQTWRMASEDASVGLDPVLTVAAFLLLLICFRPELCQDVKDRWNVRPIAARLARSHRLRPPPCVA